MYWGLQMQEKEYYSNFLINLNVGLWVIKVKINILKVSVLMKNVKHKIEERVLIL